jgi:hypothetical protein
MHCLTNAAIRHPQFSLCRTALLPLLASRPLLTGAMRAPSMNSVASMNSVWVASPRMRQLLCRGTCALLTRQTPWLRSVNA